MEVSGAPSVGSTGTGLVATARLPIHGLAVPASRPLASVLATWRESMWAMAAVTIILRAAGIALALFARGLTRRQAALTRAAVQRAATADAPMLRKPFGAAQLREAVAAALAARPSAARRAA